MSKRTQRLKKTNRLILQLLSKLLVKSLDASHYNVTSIVFHEINKWFKLIFSKDLKVSRLLERKKVEKIVKKKNVEAVDWKREKNLAPQSFAWLHTSLASRNSLETTAEREKILKIFKQWKNRGERRSYQVIMAAFAKAFRSGYLLTKLSTFFVWCFYRCSRQVPTVELANSQ